jgi:hypothetical protein
MMSCVGRLRCLPGVVYCGDALERRCLFACVMLHACHMYSWQCTGPSTKQGKLQWQDDVLNLKLVLPWGAFSR